MPRFIDKGDGTVIDRLTGLMWTKDANLIGDKSYLESLNYISAMNNGEYPNYGYTDWRMPNIVEIDSLINSGQSNTATWLNSQGFINVPEDFFWDNLYWSSTSGGAYTKVIWLCNGNSIGTLMQYSGLLWPVRSAQSGTIQLPKTGKTWSQNEGDEGYWQMGVDWPVPRFLDHGDGSVTDGLTDLMWTKDANLKGSVTTWQEALDFIESLNESKYLGYNDWRLPDRIELKSLVDHSGFSLVLTSGHPFINIPYSSSHLTGYWSSTSDPSNPAAAYEVALLWGGEIVSSNKASSLQYIWPVRAGALPCLEKSFLESNMVETVIVKKGVLYDVSVDGDLNATVDFTDFEILSITTGPFAGKGFSKGEFETVFESASYKGEWQGVIFLDQQERKIDLKGAISGEISATVEGYLDESVLGSGIYDQYHATWKISRLGNAINSVITLNLNGVITYQNSSEFSATKLHLLQSVIEGTITGHYSGPLSVVLTHLRISDTNNPYYSQGFSGISYVSDAGQGEGWTYDKEVSQGRIDMKGIFTSPLSGIVTGTLDETKTPRSLYLSIERIIASGLPLIADLEVVTWGSTRVSPSQTTGYIIEVRNDGVRSAENVVVVDRLPQEVEYISSMGGGIYRWETHEVIWKLGTLSAKDKIILTTKVQVKWGLAQGTQLSNFVVIGTTSDEIDTYSTKISPLDIFRYIDQRQIILTEYLTEEDVNTLLTTDANFNDIFNYAIESGFYYTNMSEKFTMDDGTTFIVSVMSSNSTIKGIAYPI